MIFNKDVRNSMPDVDMKRSQGFVKGFHKGSFFLVEACLQSFVQTLNFFVLCVYNWRSFIGDTYVELAICCSLSWVFVISIASSKKKGFEADETPPVGAITEVHLWVCCSSFK